MLGMCMSCGSKEAITVVGSLVFPQHRVSVPDLLYQVFYLK